MQLKDQLEVVPHERTVSVLIRTMNRSSLNAAIASVVAQSFADWEIVVVNASGMPLTSLRPDVAHHVTRLLEPGCPLNRSAAANALLDAALGKYAVFLDDDDEFLPGHLQKLVEFMTSDAKFIACYSDVTAQLKSDPTSASPRTHTYQREFDWMLLQFQNYLPIHSVMFRLNEARSPVKICFDEELFLFEDWDFWLQLASKGDFKRVPGVSALYMLDPQTGSGHAVLNAELRESMLRRLSARQLARWSAADIARLIAWENQRTEDSEHAGQQITSISRQLDLARSAVDDLTLSIKEHQSEIDKLGRLRLEHLEQINQTQARVIILSESVIEQRAEIGSLREQRTESQRQIELARAEIAALNRTLQEHQKTIESLDRLQRETLTQLEHARATSAELEQRLGVAVAAALEFEQRLRTAHANEFAQQIEIEKLGRLRLDHLNQLEQLNVQLLAMYQSRSWQLTRPFRVVRRLTAWLASPAPPRLIGNGFRAARGEIRRHGLSGFVRRLPHYLRHRKTYGAMLASPVTQTSPNRFNAPVPSRRQIRLHPELIDDKPPIDASVSVVIPTFNAGLEFRWLLRKLKAQKGLQRLEIVIVDSGSSDDTVAYAKSEGCRVIEITQAEFSHSHSRNLGAANASADYLIFMVQDAYPIGDYWAYGMLHYLLEHSESGLVAASCSEYSRSDSDMMYDSMIDTHYRFLGCHEQDRIGSYQGSDHMALRSRGQLSDVACLISRDVFSRYGYQGDYAEDLDLGIRLIKDGHRVAMLASVKVIHSHNRPAFYYLKRSYVDVIFLVGMFDDFLVPPVESEHGLVLGIASCARHVSELLPDLAGEDRTRPMSESLAQWIGVCRHRCLQLRLEGASQLGDAKLDRYIDSLGQRVGQSSPDALARAEALRFADSFFARLEHFNSFAAAVYGAEDALLQSALQDAVRKTFAAAAGSALGFMFMDSSRAKRADRSLIDQIDNELRAGV